MSCAPSPRADVPTRPSGRGAAAARRRRRRRATGAQFCQSTAPCAPAAAAAFEGASIRFASCSSGQPTGDDNLEQNRKLVDAKGRWLAPASARTRPCLSTSRRTFVHVRVTGTSAKDAHAHARENGFLRRRRDQSELRGEPIPLPRLEAKLPQRARAGVSPQPRAGPGRGGQGPRQLVLAPRQCARRLAATRSEVARRRRPRLVLI